MRLIGTNLLSVAFHRSMFAEAKKVDKVKRTRSEPLLSSSASFILPEDVRCVCGTFYSLFMNASADFLQISKSGFDI